MTKDTIAELIYCPIRKLKVVSQPEERVRQNLLRLMISELDYPPERIAVELPLVQVPTVSKEVPDLRADILCFAKSNSSECPLFPLLLVECKAHPITDRALNQLIGYNYYVGAPFIAVANDKEIRTGWYADEKKETTFVSGLPSYSELLSSLN